MGKSLGYKENASSLGELFEESDALFCSYQKCAAGSSGACANGRVFHSAGVTDGYPTEERSGRGVRPVQDVFRAQELRTLGVVFCAGWNSL